MLLKAAWVRSSEAEATAMNWKRMRKSIRGKGSVLTVGKPGQPLDGIRTPKKS